ncbi:LOW QUALITY PROTEIN: microsomal glutathione S-transferase 1-like [Dugong dugon]
MGYADGCRSSRAMSVGPSCIASTWHTALHHRRQRTRRVDLTQPIKNEVFMAFVSFTTTALSKMMFLNVAAAFYRLTRKVFVNREDHTIRQRKNAKKYLQTDGGVQLGRRTHLNDLENNVSFLGIGLLDSLSDLDLSTALLHLRLVGARIHHTISYLTPFPQPWFGFGFPTQIEFWRFFFVGYGVTSSKAYSLLKNRLHL